MPVGNYVFSTVNVLVVSGVFQINSLYGIHYLDLVIRLTSAKIYLKHLGLVCDVLEIETRITNQQ